MNKYCLLLAYFFPLLSNGQDLPPGFFDTSEKLLDSTRMVVSYRLQLAPDSTDLTRKVSDFFVLHIGDSISRFVPLGIYEMRKEIEYANIKSIDDLISFAQSRPPPSNRTESFFEIFKNFPKGKITTRDMIFNSNYIYEEKADVLRWQLTGVEDEYKGLRTLEATTTYAGRQWIARFAPDIPITEGPYKFHGLPGLIVQMRDTGRNFAIVMESVEHPEFPTEILFPLEPGVIETTISNFIKARNSFANNPSHTIGDFISDPHTRAVAASNAGRRNNFIERSAD